MPLNIDWQQILLHLFNFVILAAGLTFLLFNPVRKFLENRRKHFEEREDSAARKEKSAAEKEAAYTEKLAAADNEIADRKAEAEAESKEIVRRGEKDAQERASEIMTRVSAEAEAERRKVIDGVGKELAGMVVSATEKLLTAKQSAATDEMLYDGFLSGSVSDAEKALAEADEAERDAQLRIRAAEIEAKRIVADARGRVAVARDKLLADAGREMADVVAEAAEKLLTEDHTQASDEAAYDNFLDMVARGELK